MSDPVKAITSRIDRRCGALATTVLGRSESDPWQSLTFDGGRHQIELRFSGLRIDDALDALREEIGGPDFAIPGHMIAEIRISGIERSDGEALVRLDAMTIAN
ncbi:hypothetical protein [Rhizorhabdus argentea]|uniref:hypothetical protein n=1 Tax=Rhizorhabdus argentea TaxID=1387174 RepID=UPI0030EF890D